MKWSPAAGIAVSPNAAAIVSCPSRRQLDEHPGHRPHAIGTKNQENMNRVTELERVKLVMKGGVVVRNDL
ncbi:MAG TPA: hypothetical protein VII12_02350 [Thermoanaerobaculia bacterium]|jgi:hypothetical protein